jgi:protoporphyrin/coproporphyrin ferrochelatase
MTVKKIGLLVMAYGTPRNEAEIEPYYTHIRRGRKPSPEALKDLTERYEAIGGVSPLAKITEDQAYGLEKTLNEMFSNIEFKAYIGYKHIDPFIEDAVQQMKNDGIEEGVGLVLAPHFSTFSVKSYNNRAQEEADKLGGMSFSFIESWYDEPKFIDYWVKEINKTYESMPAEEKEAATLIVSAHSLPERIIAMGDPYPKQLEETAALIAEQGHFKHVHVGWQSEGNTPDPWIGPDVQDLTRDLFKEHGYKAFVYAPVGFVADHLEVLYDNDYECKVVTDELGVSYYRPEMPNAKPEFLDCLAAVVSKCLKIESV